MKNMTPKEKEIAGNLKAALWYNVSKMVEHEVALLNTNSDHEEEITASDTFVAGMVELVYNQARKYQEVIDRVDCMLTKTVSLGEDLESFAKHAKRKTISPQDLYMVTRRNNVLTEEIQKFQRGETVQDPADDELSDLDEAELLELTRS
ncbi:unnamed protein product [Kuraishia capsulata CBS 1993]|uniref:MHF histone-fold complex subunit 1 n=1 Tax=Kuraishia capsulata CBS 1993 TaxID=1382522 RepID=W6MQE4_9ASCO|nr:uncharacterized protein KUCA_T00004896001 [Kuraishia capsulata CBS 1993]CDK28911.1 unnamed protein product [Kuraishia capsulata CBS 1993]